MKHVYPPRRDGRVDQQGDPLPDTIADLTIEPTLRPGESITLACGICEGDPEYRSLFEASPCWRCKGVGSTNLTVRPERCPGCDENLLGEQIARKSMGAYGSTHFLKTISLSANDMTQAWMCPHCSCRWSRWDGRILDKEETVEQLHREVEGTRYTSGTGQVIGVHKKSRKCKDHACCIHSPSDHEYRAWSTHYNFKAGRMERVNPETGEHVHDPDDLAYKNRTRSA